MDRATIEGVRRISDGGRTNEEYLIDKLATEVERLEEQYESLRKSSEQALAALEDDGILWISAAAILRAALHNSNPATGRPVGDCGTCGAQRHVFLETVVQGESERHGWTCPECKSWNWLAESIPATSPDA